MNEMLGKAQRESVLNETMIHLEKEVYSMEEIVENLINRLEPFCNNKQLIEGKENIKNPESIHSPFITQLKDRIRMINQTKGKLIDLSKRLEI